MVNYREKKIEKIIFQIIIIGISIWVTIYASHLAANVLHISLTEYRSWYSNMLDPSVKQPFTTLENVILPFISNSIAYFLLFIAGIINLVLFFKEIMLKIIDHNPEKAALITSAVFSVIHFGVLYFVNELEVKLIKYDPNYIIGPILLFLFLVCLLPVGKAEYARSR